MRLAQEQRLLTNFSVSSLTDIVMLLLIFFLLSSSFVIQPGIKVQLPKAETGETPRDNSLTVTITEKGRLYVNSDQVTVENLGRKLSSLLERNRDQVVVIKADKDVTLQKTVQVIDIAKAVGATRFMIATTPRDVQ
jgi:biopolymer transport protein ExbD